MKYKGRLLDLESQDLSRIFADYNGVGSSPALFIALRQVLFDEVSGGRSPPTLWIHNTFGPSGIVTIGNGEKPTRVNLEACRELGVPVYVRTSGGWHIYNDSSFIFTNMFIPLTDPYVFENHGIKHERDTTGAFKLNSGLVTEALKRVGINASMLPYDPSSLLANENLIAVNSARFTHKGPAHKGLYMEGGLRYSPDELRQAVRVLKMSDEERKELVERNTSITDLQKDVSMERMKSILFEVYTTMGGFENYDWRKQGLTPKEIETTAEYTSSFRSIADMEQREVDLIGTKEGKICILHWIAKYGPYTPGAY